MRACLTLSHPLSQRWHSHLSLTVVWSFCQASDAEPCSYLCRTCGRVCLLLCGYVRYVPTTTTNNTRMTEMLFLGFHQSSSCTEDSCFILYWLPQKNHFHSTALQADLCTFVWEIPAAEQYQSSICQYFLAYVCLLWSRYEPDVINNIWLIYNMYNMNML